MSDLRTPVLLTAPKAVADAGRVSLGGIERAL